MNEELTHALPVDECDGECETVTQLVALTVVDGDAEGDEVDVWHSDDEMLPLREGVPLGVKVELTHALTVVDCDGECETVTLEVALAVVEKDAEEDKVDVWHPEEETLALTENEPGCE